MAGHDHLMEFQVHSVIGTIRLRVQRFTRAICQFKSLSAVSLIGLKCLGGVDVHPARRKQPTAVSSIRLKCIPATGCIVIDLSTWIKRNEYSTENNSGDSIENEAPVNSRPIKPRKGKILKNQFSSSTTSLVFI